MVGDGGGAGAEQAAAYSIAATAQIGARLDMRQIMPLRGSSLEPDVKIVKRVEAV
jgi:hypothetical protein